MREPAKIHQDSLKIKKEMIIDFRKAWQENINRFNYWRQLIYKTTISDTERSILVAIDKPVVEFNIMQPYVDRALGEYSENEPSVTATKKDGANVSSEQLHTIGGYIRHVIEQAQRQSQLYRIYQDCLSGGYSAGIIYTDWANSTDFSQVIKVKRAFDPTLCGWDLMGELPHKGDAEYCFQSYPRCVDDILKQYSFADVGRKSWIRKNKDFGWAYESGGKKYMMESEFYKKEYKEHVIYFLADESSILKEHYEMAIAAWDRTEQPPQVIAERKARKCTIYRDIFIEDQVLSHEATNYTELPIVFFDGNSIDIRESGTNKYGFSNDFGNGSNGRMDLRQMTKPMVYNALGTQQLKNFTGQTLANELEALIQSKFMIAMESLPPEGPYLDAYTNIQKANTLVWKSADPNNPDRPLPSPQTIQRPPIPPEIAQAFQLCDITLQNTLGAFEAGMGNNGSNPMSGKAVAMHMMMSDSVMKPYIYNHMQSLTQIAKGILGLIPSVHITKKMLPIIDIKGERQEVFINGGQEHDISMDFDPETIGIEVEAGLNSSLKRQRAIDQFVTLSRAYPKFGEFFGAVGLPIVVDNLEVEGADVLKEMLPQYMQEQKQKEQQLMQQQQQQMQNNPLMMKAQNERMKIEQDAKLAMMENQLDMQRIDMERMKNQVLLLQTLSAHEDAKLDAAVRFDEHKTNKLKAAVELMTDVKDMAHRHERESKQLEHAEIELLHTIEKDYRESEMTQQEEINNG